MADFHSLTSANEIVRYVIHVAVPNTNNSAGVNHRTALINSGMGGKTILPDGDGTLGTISSAEKTAIVAGSIYEYVNDFPINLVVGSKPTFIAALIVSDSARVVAELQKRLQWFGFTQ